MTDCYIIYSNPLNLVACEKKKMVGNFKRHYETCPGLTEDMAYQY